ncbi:MAG TPA: COX15/CtaA family protein [Streptosporangiaceae bacterium]|nr:COX15/CtaA family protein [Streptosporangiaceae bacterium]
MSGHLAPPNPAAVPAVAGLEGAGWRARLRALARAVLAPSPAAMRRLALAGIVISVVIILSGAAVRLSQSGLGCSDWPRCSAHDLAAGGSGGESLVHQWIEFGNRLVTVAIFVIAVLVTVAAWQFRPVAGAGRRRDLVWLAAAQPGCIVVQAVVGGIVVLTKLNPGWVSVHFVASMAPVAAAVALYVRCQEGTGPARPLVPRLVRGFALGVIAAVALMMTAGTVVTGTGPLAGAADVPRYPLPQVGVTQFHADIGWFLGALLVGLIIAMRLTAAPRRAVRLGWLVAALIGLQGVVGYAQYFSGLPAGLVWVHETGAAAIWLAVLFLPFALRERAALPATAPARVKA